LFLYLVRYISYSFLGDDLFNFIISWAILKTTSFYLFPLIPTAPGHIFRDLDQQQW
jgi:hypothetical protein